MKIVLMGGEDVHSRIEIAKKFIGMGFDIEILGTEDEDRFIKNGYIIEDITLIENLEY